MTQQLDPRADRLRLLQEIERVRYVATNYGELQGLTVVPFSAAFFVWAAWQIGWRPTNPYLLAACIIPIVIALSLLIEQHYKRRYGQVKSLPRPPESRKDKRQFWVRYVLTVAALALVTEIKETSPVDVVGLYFAASIAVFDWRSLKPTAFGAVMVMVIVAASLLPLLDPAPREYPSAPVLVTMGLLTFVGGVIQHIKLVRLLKPLPPATDDDAV